MELLVTIAYIFLVRLVFFDYKLLKFTLLWKFAVFGLYITVVLTEVIMLGQYAPYSKTMFVQAYVVQMAPEYGGKVIEVFVTPNEFVAKGSPHLQDGSRALAIQVGRSAGTTCGYRQTARRPVARGR